MNPAVEVAAIAAPTILALAVLATTAAAREWVHIAVTVTVKPIPAAKRKPKAAVEVVTVVPGTVETSAPPIATVRRTGT